MAKKFLTHINLSGNHLLNAALQPSAFAPNAMAAGQIYYNTSDGGLYYSTGTGTGSWQRLAQGTTSVASINNFTGSVTINGTTNNISVVNDNNTITLNIGSNVVTLSDNQTLTNKTLSDNTLGTNLDADSYKIVNLGAPTSNNDAATKKYVDDSISNVDLNIVGTVNQIVTDTQPGITTLSLDTTVRIDDALKIGTDLNSPVISLDAVSGEVFIGGNGVNGSFTLQRSDNTNRFSVDTNGRVNFYDAYGNNFIRIDGDTLTGYQGLNINAYNSAFPGAGNLELYAEQNTDIRSGANVTISANDNNQGGDVSVSGLSINLNSPTYVNNSNLYVQDSNSSTIFQVDPANQETTVKGTLRFLDQNASFEALETVNNQVEFYIAADNSIRLNSTNGGIYLEPATWAYVNDDPIVTETTSQTLSNKTISDNLQFENTGGVSTIGADGNNLNIVSNNGDINITSNSANIVLNADSNVYVGYVNSDNIVVGTGLYQTLSNKTLGTNTILAANVNADGYTIVNVSDPVNAQDVANKRYVDAAVAGLSWKQPVNVLADTNISLTGSTPLTIDNHAVQDGYRVLLTGQSTNTENGIYSVAISDGAYTLTRSLDADTNDELIGVAVFVMEGDLYGTTSWTQTNHYITGFANQTWVQFAGTGTYTAGTGLTLSGTEFRFNPTAGGGLNNDGSIKLDINSGLQTTTSGLSVVAGDGIIVESGAVKVDPGYVARKITATLTKSNSANQDGFQWTVEHNLNTYDVVVRAYQIAPNDGYQYADVEVDIIRNSQDEILVEVAQALDPTASIGIVILG